MKSYTSKASTGLKLLDAIGVVSDKRGGGWVFPTRQANHLSNIYRDV